MEDTTLPAGLMAFLDSNNGPAMPLALALMRQGFRSPYEKPRGFGNELTDAFGQWQQMKTNSTLNKMNQEKLEAYKREAEKQKKMEGLSEQLAKLPQQFMKPAVPGAIDQGQIGPNLPIQSQQGQQLAEQMGSGGTIADLLALNQSSNYAQQGTPQEMPLQGQPASMDYKGLMQAAGPIQAQLDPQGYFKGIQGQAEQARKAQEWEQYIQSLPPEIKNNPAAMAVLGGGPELAGKLGPGVLPSVLKPQEKKSPTSVQEYEFAKEQGFNGSYLEFVKAMKEKPVQVNFGGGRGAGKPMTELQKVKLNADMSKDFSSAEQTVQTMENIKTAIKDIKDSKGLSAREGYTGYVPAWMQGKEAMSAENRINTLKGKVTQMGKAMATLSGAIGPMAVQEWKIVSDAVNAIDPTAGNFAEQLSNIEAQADGAIERIKDSYDRKYADHFGQKSNFSTDKIKGGSKSTDTPADSGMPPPGAVKRIR